MLIPLLALEIVGEISLKMRVVRMYRTVQYLRHVLIAKF